MLDIQDKSKNKTERMSKSSKNKTERMNTCKSSICKRFMIHVKTGIQICNVKDIPESWENFTLFIRTLLDFYMAIVNI